jgi:hypothetical protein
MIPGIEPSGTSTEQIRDAAASPEKRPGFCFWLVAATGDDDAGRDVVCWIGAGGGDEVTEVAAEMVMFF